MKSPQKYKFQLTYFNIDNTSTANLKLHTIFNTRGNINTYRFLFRLWACALAILIYSYVIINWEIFSSKKIILLWILWNKYRYVNEQK